jgi:hydroxymethylbilane synthase
MTGPGHGIAVILRRPAPACGGKAGAFPGGRRSAPGSVGRVETVIVGARGSRLAQAMVQELITHLVGCPVVQFKARSVMTVGDKDRKTPPRNLGGGEGGVFTTQLEQELLAGNVDIAVHSLKDLPTAPPDGLVLAVTPPRADPLDALCGSTLEGLRPGARVGTGSARRIAQLKALRPDVEVVPIRGNVPARLARVKSGLDAVILAASGLRRLGLDDAITELLDPVLFPPSPGQGALAVQVRAADRELLEMLNAFGDPGADAAVRAERVLLGDLHGGCSVPVGAYAVRSGGVVSLSAQVTSLDGRHRVTGAVTGPDPEAAGRELAALLRDRGADAILDQIREPAGR